MSNLFTYGSLMFPQVWKEVVSGNYRSQNSTLRGFIRKQARGETYPVIVRGPDGSLVDGVLYHGISASDLERLDRFEGDCYARAKVSVMTARGRSDDAFVYVLKEAYRHMLSPHDWDAEVFERQGIRQFLAEYCGFER